MQELYSGLSYYGIGKIIKEYAHFPNCLPCPVGIQHGWAQTTHSHDARYDAPENWFWTEDLAIKYQNEYQGLNIRVVGSPFLYLLANLNYTESSTKKGSIVFPAHSTHVVGVKCDFSQYADLLDNLPSEYKPITICMYYLDMERGSDIPFREKGFEIVKNGNSLHDVNFLRQFIKNVHGKKYAFSNQATSALLFSSAMGLTSFFYGPQYIDYAQPSYSQTLAYEEDTKKWEYHPLQHFEFPVCNIEQQRRFVAEQLGKHFLYTPKDMRNILYKSMFNKHYFFKLLFQLFQTSKNLIKLYFPFVLLLYTKINKSN